jgi:hypothetical protein
MMIRERGIIISFKYYSKNIFPKYIIKKIFKKYRYYMPIFEIIQNRL